MGNAASTISLGDDVFDPAGEKLGEVTRVIVDARTDTFTEVVVKHGNLLNSTERVMMRSSLSSRGDHELTSSLSREEFDELQVFDADRYHAPDPDYSGPPGFDIPAKHQANFALDSVVAMGPLAGIGAAGRPFGYPGGESPSAQHEVQPDLQLPAVERGTAVLDADGEKVGEVEEMAFGADGVPQRLVVQRGFIFKHSAEIPVSEIAEISGDGIWLTGTREALATRFES